MARAAERGRNSCPSIAGVVQHCDTTTQLGQSGVQSRRWWPAEVSTRYCGNRAFNRVPAHENSVAGRRAVPETVPRTKEPRARSLRFCARVVSPLPPSLFFHPFFSSFIPCHGFPSRFFSVSFSPLFPYSASRHCLYLLYCSFTGYLSLIPGYTRWTRVRSLHKARVHD